ncbi:MAG: hypothetical protein M0D57_21890 [Sphingobacteriales bacterium JAD_PAG50586_3]|nr:MAG: hypothetical protein M0D57_21890 [Sphingobacteriales bacterium JAD_PAG50586_3]
MNEPVIKEGLNPEKDKKAPSQRHIDKSAKPADEQGLETENRVPKPGSEPTKTQDENVKKENLKDARNPDLDYTIPPIIEPILPLQFNHEEIDNKGD